MTSVFSSPHKTARQTRKARENEKVLGGQPYRGKDKSVTCQCGMGAGRSDCLKQTAQFAAKRWAEIIGTNSHSRPLAFSILSPPLPTIEAEARQVTTASLRSFLLRIQQNPPPLANDTTNRKPHLTNGHLPAAATVIVNIVPSKPSCVLTTSTSQSTTCPCASDRSVLNYLTAGCLSESLQAVCRVYGPDHALKSCCSDSC